MPFIPKIILFDNDEGYNILAHRRVDSVVKEYITLNPNHEFVQYLFSASDEEGYNIYGFVVKVPYDIDIEQFEKLKTPLMDGYKDMDLNESEPSLREEQIEKTSFTGGKRLTFIKVVFFSMSYLRSRISL